MVKYSYVTAYIFGKTEAQQMEKIVERIKQNVHQPLKWENYNNTIVRNNTNFHMLLEVLIHQIGVFIA